MSHPDPLLMLADIAQVASERPELDGKLVQALYQNLLMTQGRQPAIGEVRDYVDRLTSSVDAGTLRRRLGLMTPRKSEPRAPTKPRRGRPKGTGLLTAAIVRSNNSALRTDLQGRAPTQDALASRLEVSIRTLQDFLKANDLRWPLED